MTNKINWALLLIITTFNSFAGIGFQDEGFLQAKVRSDYNSNTVTYGSPYIVNCIPGTIGICPNIPSTDIWDYSNFYSENGGDTSSTYWVLSVNNEDALSHLNSGPPNQSEPIYTPSSSPDLFSFTTYKQCDHCNEIPDATCPNWCEDFYRAHMILKRNDLNPLNPRSQNPNSNDLGIHGKPFLAINAASNRGNNQPVAILNGTSKFDKNIISFDAKIYSYSYTNLDSGIVVFYVYFIAEWDGINRLLFVDIGHSDNYDEVKSGSVGFNKEWNWPVEQSFYHNGNANGGGADLAYMDAESVSNCDGISIDQFDFTASNSGANLGEKHFSINQDKLFKCASDAGLFETPMPDHRINVNIVGWAIELGGGSVEGNPASIWAAISNMKTSKNISISPLLPFNPRHRTSIQDSNKNEFEFEMYKTIKDSLLE